MIHPTVYSDREQKNAIARKLYWSFIFLAQWFWSGEKDLFFKPFAAVHRAVEKMVIHSKKQIKVIGLPRGFGKTKLMSVLYVVWSIFVRRRRYVVLLSYSQKKSKQNLRDINRLIHNKHFRKIFPWERGSFWGAEAIEIKLPNGETIIIEAKGGMQTIFGASEGQARPDLLLMDDIEDLKLVKNIDRIEALQEWLFTEVLPAINPSDVHGTPGEIVYIGTPLNSDCLFARAMTWSHSADVILHGALDKNDKSIWEARHPTEGLLKKRAEYMESGMMHSWNSQYMLKPDSKGILKFTVEKLLDISIKEKQNMIRKKAYQKIVIIADMAYTQKNYSDPSGISVAGHNIGSVFDTLEVHQDTWSQLEIYHKLCEIEKSYSNFDDVQIFCESLVFDVIKALFQQYNITYKRNLNIYKMERPKGHYTDSKNQRIGQLVPYFNSGLWRICTRDSKPLMPQLWSWDSKSQLPTDDAIDATSMQCSHVIVGERPQKTKPEEYSEAGEDIRRTIEAHEREKILKLEMEDDVMDEINLVCG